MHIVQITPGTGNFHCGNCLRDLALVRALRACGHTVDLVPLYLPMVGENGLAEPQAPIFFGGINVYLQQKSFLFRHTPRWLDAWLDRPGLLRKAADRAGMTRARDLGELTCSMLAGEEGRQKKELDRLVSHLKSTGRPDLVVLSNALLLGLARRLGSELGCPVVCTLMGEDAFLDSLIAPYSDRAWKLLSERARDASAFVAVSDYYGSVMTRRAALPAHRVHRVYNGIDLAGFAPAETAPYPPVLGFFARLCPGKGLETTVDTYLELMRRGRLPDLRLHLGGSLTPSDEPFISGLRKKLDAAGHGGRVQWLFNPDHAAKQDFIRGFSALCVPARYGESFGFYLIEAWASGVPVVQPDRGVYGELLALSGAGILARDDAPQTLADALEPLLMNETETRRLGLLGRQCVQKHFSIEAMAGSVESLYRRLTGPTPTSTPAASSGEPAHA